jgi:hypothetical protein
MSDDSQGPAATFVEGARDFAPGRAADRARSSCLGAPEWS